MKKYFILVLLFTYTALATDQIELKIPNSEIEAFRTTDGAYSRVIDIQDGFEEIEGVKVIQGETFISPKNAKNLEELLLINGSKLFFLVCQQKEVTWVAEVLQNRHYKV